MKKILLLFGGVLYIVMTFMTFAMAADQKQVEDKKETKKNKDNTSSKAWITEGSRAYRAQRYDEALAIYKKAAEEDPQSVDANYNLALIYDKKGMLEESIEAYKEVISIKPDHAQAYNNLGTVYEKKDMSIKAIAQYKLAVSKDPNLPQAQYNLGRAFFKEGLLVQAGEHLYNAGLLFLKRGDRKWAENSYNLLKKTRSDELTNALFVELYPDKTEKE